MNPIRYRLGKRVLRIQTMGLYEPQKSSPYDFLKICWIQSWRQPLRNAYKLVKGTSLPIGSTC